MNLTAVELGTQFPLAASSTRPLSHDWVAAAETMSSPCWLGADVTPSTVARKVRWLSAGAPAAMMQVNEVAESQVELAQGVLPVPGIS